MLIAGGDLAHYVADGVNDHVVILTNSSKNPGLPFGSLSLKILKSYIGS